MLFKSHREVHCSNCTEKVDVGTTRYLGISKDKKFILICPKCSKNDNKNKQKKP